MSETEKLLNAAADMAKRRFIDPSESAVMDLFRELCAERERTAYDEPEHVGATLH
ncbi:hypothetical protein [Bordetella avium]|nr:hypothetical protein [Bordetella avium]UOK17247.1 hypothetical protein vBBaMIFTN4_55 [Bordetella phage vB_BaM-IFTN4]UOK17526.1 hypothetical protein vBBaMIFTN8_61 [Bordetella phage vB_BaM-IFTN8]WQE34681.1 hypothetical protein U0029_05940 [Bordetella avium]SUV68319.1 Uncharacterised protein [Bordetella avium]SUW68985.1 Uncharacterised protein [Bordetella avium]